MDLVGFEPMTQRLSRRNSSCLKPRRHCDSHHRNYTSSKLKWYDTASVLFNYLEIRKTWQENVSNIECVSSCCTICARRNFSLTNITGFRLTLAQQVLYE
jgi:hypothetical protein